MGVYIPNMEKPKSCGECEFNYNLEGGSYEWWECVILHDDINQFDTRRTDCPLIEIVECKDCKYWTDDMSGNMWCEHAIGGLTEPTDFCSYGDRIDEYEKEYRELGLYELRELRKGERRTDGDI